MTQNPFDSVSRRGFLGGVLGLGATAALAGCGFSGDTTTPTGASSSLAPAAKAKVDGDLVYFNWAEYLDKDVRTGFEKEYGVKIDLFNGKLSGLVSQFKINRTGTPDRKSVV